MFNEIAHILILTLSTALYKLRFRRLQVGKTAVIYPNTEISFRHAPKVHLTYSLNRTKGKDTPEPVHIGNNVWIGLNAIILKGTTIGDHSIVSAGSVVKGVFPPYSIISGNPATVVKTLDAGRFR